MTLVTPWLPFGSATGMPCTGSVLKTLSTLLQFVLIVRNDYRIYSNNFVLSFVRLLIKGGSYSRVATINFV